MLFNGKKLKYLNMFTCTILFHKICKFFYTENKTLLLLYIGVDSFSIFV
jgi:hypothetical protein